MAKDPVCNMDVDENKTQHKSERDGESVSFCSQQCKDKFDRNPEDYEIAA